MAWALSAGVAAGRVVTRFRLAATAAIQHHDFATTALPTRGTVNAEDPYVLYQNLRQRFGHLGVLSHRRVGARDLIKILRACKTPADFKIALKTMNLLYNFGVKLRHRELASRLLSAAMLCGEGHEAVDLVVLYGAWLEHPPDPALVYTLMGHCLDVGEISTVRELAKAVREDWRMPLHPTLYARAIEAMLWLPGEQDPVSEAMAIYEDACSVGVRLPARLHLRLLDTCLTACEAAIASQETDVEGAPGEAASPALVQEPALTWLRSALFAADGLAAAGHVRGGGSAASLCSLAWLLWHLQKLPAAEHAHLRSASVAGGTVTCLGGSWARVFEGAIVNFGCHWGFSQQLPVGLFRGLAASDESEADRLVRLARVRLGRFFPSSI